MPKFQFSGGGGGGVKTENTQSAKKCLNFNFGGGKAGGGGVKTENTQSAKKCLNFNFWGGGVVVSKLKILKVPRNA